MKSAHHSFQLCVAVMEYIFLGRETNGNRKLVLILHLGELFL